MVDPVLLVTPDPPATVIPPPAPELDSKITPKPSKEPAEETLLNVTVPPPDWAKVIRAPFGSIIPAVVSDDTFTADAEELLMTILPLLESAAMDWEAILSAVVAPIPESAARVIDGVVIKPEPLMFPALR